LPERIACAGGSICIALLLGQLLPVGRQLRLETTAPDDGSGKKNQRKDALHQSTPSFCEKAHFEWTYSRFFDALRINLRGNLGQKTQASFA
jgi:hypothetical protein